MKKPSVKCRSVMAHSASAVVEAGGQEVRISCGFGGSYIHSPRISICHPGTFCVSYTEEQIENLCAVLAEMLFFMRGVEVADIDVVQNHVAQWQDIWAQEKDWTPAQWLRRWTDCFPATYPPELYFPVFRTVTERGGLFRRAREITVYHAECRRCGAPIMTGHMCADVRSYAMSLDGIEADGKPTV